MSTRTDYIRRSLVNVEEYIASDRIKDQNGTRDALLELTRIVQDLARVVEDFTEQEGDR